ncbi:hypothetical protein ARMGADRAFT_1078415 [Armillaria gallica]|uniref:Uncharacterized protein n=1 Tax=Armillaria gallica TaxID=47427 RepID=A0A2H3E4F8_ARMGA|nr:hypothetical protein ARMGADRAFT_1078415 [Armillaria gallica]
MAHHPDSAASFELDRNVWAEPDPWSGWEDAHPDLDPDYPSITRWMDKNIPAFLREWPIPMGDLRPATFELPDALMERDPVPSYERRDPQELPRAHPRPLQPEEHNSIPFPTTTQHRPTRTICVVKGPALGYSPWPTEDSDTNPNNEPRPSTHTLSDQMTTLSTQEGLTTSGPSSRRSTERFSAPIEQQPGSSGDRILNDDSSGLTLGTHKYGWTSTSLLKAATQSWENTLTPTWSCGYMPTEPGTSIHPTWDRGFPMHSRAPPMNRQYSQQASAHWPSYTRNGLRSKDFNFDRETFGQAIEDDRGDPHQYWHEPGPLPDVPPDPHCPGYYTGPRTS